MKRAEKLPSEYQDDANDLVAVLKKYGLRVQRYKIKAIPDGPREGMEVLFMNLQPRFRVPSGVIVSGDLDSYVCRIVKRKDGGWIETSGDPKPHDSGFLSIYAERAHIATEILSTRNDSEHYEWSSLEEYLKTHDRTMIASKDDDSNDWHVFGRNEDAFAFIGSHSPDIAESVVLLAAHTQLKHGIAAVNRQFQFCSVIY